MFQILPMLRGLRFKTELGWDSQVLNGLFVKTYSDLPVNKS